MRELRAGMSVLVWRRHYFARQARDAGTLGCRNDARQARRFFVGRDVLYHLRSSSTQPR